MNARVRLVLVRNESESPAPAPAQIQLEFAQCCPLTDSEQSFLCASLARHSEAQLIADELAGQMRKRGRGQKGIRDPHALASLLAREALANGTQYWYHWQAEAELRQQGQGAAADNKPSAGPTPPAALARVRPETLAAARIEAQRIKERHAERRLQLQLLQGGKK